MGPTQEPIDPVRYISNRSSGRMGAALAREGLKRGHEITIISGPVNIPLPEGARIHRVTTSGQMIKTTLSELEKGYDVMISAAAISDYSVDYKEKKIDSGRELSLKLKPQVKLTKHAKELYPKTLVVAFKAETNAKGDELVKKARKKIHDEGVDLVVANDVSGRVFGSGENEVYIVNGGVLHVPRASKALVSEKIWDAVESKIQILLLR
ncbi:MAG: hypothetical protein MSIBF_01100 [Candidatus Altiarchaeales archaeon IMC4]|nr:MAG: hypothetical protein MSIBF_01100 [Candidatus Altiarchaeales archaeon IMC4]